MRDAVQTACRVRLRPILMTSLATIIGLIPMALKLGTGSEAYAPLARAIIGGLLTSLVMTIYIVPAAFLMVYERRAARAARARILAPALISILIALSVFLPAEARASAEPPVEHLSLQDAERLALQPRARYRRGLLSGRSREASRQANARRLLPADHREHRRRRDVR